MNRLTSEAPDNFRDAAAYARRMVVGVELGVATTGVLRPPQDVFDYCFTLQGEVEKTGQMNYHEYAARMWSRLLPGVTAEGHGFPQFEQHMIVGLHSIDMSRFVYPAVTETMPKLIDTYKDRIAGVAMWSTGDVRTTGYQLAKIDRSRVVHGFLSSLRGATSKSERYEFVRDKTSYLVDDNKFDRLTDYVSSRVTTDGSSPPLKLVIIEDSVGNFAKARVALADQIQAGRVEIIPIWFTGSREGIKAHKQVEDLASAGDAVAHETERVKLEQKKADSNAIASFTELLDTDRFGAILENAHVMVDFDGVICDNVAMREQQAATIYTALVSGAISETGLSAGTLEARFQAILQQAAA